MPSEVLVFEEHTKIAQNILYQNLHKKESCKKKEQKNGRKQDAYVCIPARLFLGIVPLVQHFKEHVVGDRACPPADCEKTETRENVAYGLELIHSDAEKDQHENEPSDEKTLKRVLALGVKFVFPVHKNLPSTESQLRLKLLYSLS